MSVKVNNLLLRLISSAESSKFIVILTNIERQGLSLFKKFLQSTPKDDSTHLVTLEHDLKQLHIGPLKGITTHQLFGVDFDQKVLNYLLSLPYGRNIFIDSVLPLIFLYPDQFLKIISQLKLKFNRIVTLAHSDVLSSTEFVTLREVADTVIEIPSLDNIGTYTLTHKKIRSGVCTSLMKVMEGFRVDENGEFVIMKPKDSTTEPANTSDALEDLPFSLRADLEETSKVDLQPQSR